MRRCRWQTKQALGLGAWLIAGLAGLAEAAEGGKADLSPKATSTEQVRFFEEKVRPILSARCIKCHGGSGKVRGGLRLDDRSAVLKGGDLGPAVSLDRPEESVLLQAIRYEELEMPPGGKLPQGEQDILTRWVKDGLPWGATPSSAPVGATVTSSAAPVASRSVAAARREWLHRPVVRPAVPSVKRRGWVRNPVDAFILARLEAERLRPAPEADCVALIRRLTYDLTGLPPTPEEVDAFLADRAHDAYERLVDRLLASPHYGEHWARHWLDLVRFGETNGYERDSAKPFAWRYRDYVIDAYNRDKPYDRFVREQLAGDEINPGSAESLIATGFYRLGIWDDEPADRPQARYDTLDGIISTTGQVVLGMTVNCARCHDHKVDPIPQRDYYRLLAFFIDVTHPDGKNLRKVETGAGMRIEVMSVTERGHDQAHVLLRGSPALVGPAVEPGVPEVLDAGTGSIAKGPGKRRALAEWLTEPRNPRTARVLANRIWQYHFGRGIVPTPNDFGKLGEPATHPELLDWLAAELVADGWQIKPMHRLIVMSSAYRMSSRATPAELAADPSDRWFWRFPMRRLAAEEVRDAMLAVSGDLRYKAGGPSVYPPIPREVMAGQSVPGSGWKTSTPDEAARRSVYVHVKRSLLVPILAVHDAADTDSSCPVRYTTTVPTQALGMLNGAFANEQAVHLAERLRREAPGDLDAQVRRALRLTAARNADQDEVRGDVEFIQTLMERSRLDERAALSQYCLMILNANAFLYLD
ncbi:MAG: PSD1 and planctomycete cytochrome C domain-containing protein [Isosphaeraceae bacterium]